MRVDTANNKLLKLIEEPTDKTVMLCLSEFRQASCNNSIKTSANQSSKTFRRRSGGRTAEASRLSEDSSLGWVHVTEGNVTAANRLCFFWNGNSRFRIIFCMDEGLLG